MGFFGNKLLLNILGCGLILSFSHHGLPLSKVQNAYYLKQVQNNNGKKSKEETQKWKKYTYEENGFSIELPAEPEHIHQTIDIPRADVKIEYDTYLSELNESVVYVISVWHYPSEIDMTKPEENLKDGFEGMLSALPDAEVVRKKVTEHDGFKTLDFKVKKDKIFFEGKLILVYNTLYQVFAVYKSNQEKKADVSRFVKSFKLLDPEQNKPKEDDGFFNTMPHKKMKVYNALPNDFFSIQ